MVARVAAVSEFLTLTVASGTTAPDESSDDTGDTAGWFVREPRDSRRSRRSAMKVRIGEIGAVAFDSAEKELDTNREDDCGFIDPPDR